MNYECVFENKFTITYGHSIKTTITNVEVDLGSVVGKFDVAFSLFTDNTFALPIQGNNNLDNTVCHTQYESTI